MCGIVGYTGFRPASEVLLEGLRNLEYRGYDSAGVTVFEEGGMTTVKALGRLSSLEEKLSQTPLQGHCGIAHTRWATHGIPSDVNAHPHSTQKVSLIHNGIVENYLELKTMLQKAGYTFQSQTDTEVAAKLLDYLYDGNPLATLQKALEMIEGSYAFGILFADFPDRVFGAKKDNPLIAAIGQHENFILSDISAALRYTKDFYVLGDGEMVEITPEQITIYNRELQPVSKEKQTAHWNVEQAQKGGYAHFMLKEIYEQPTALQNTIHPRIKNGLPNFAGDNIPSSLFTHCNRVIFVACGTAMYAGTVGRYLIESIARIPVSVEIASEFRYNNPIIGPGDLVIVISQSGETADSLAALRLAKEKGADTLAVVNVIGSTIAREADHVIYTYAGPEIAVASTKAYTVQVGIMYLLAFSFGLCRGQIEEAQCIELTKKLLQVPSAIGEALKQSQQMEEISKSFLQGVESLFFIGRGLDFALAYEGSLKLKEITYLHSEAYAAGELKHGPISLVSDSVPVVALATQNAILPKTVSNVKEVKARNARTLLICKPGVTIDHDAYDYLVTIPQVDDLFAPLPTVVLLQFLAYYKAVDKGCDVDKPRNLAKSVTVE